MKLKIIVAAYLLAIPFLARGEQLFRDNFSGIDRTGTLNQTAYAGKPDLFWEASNNVMVNGKEGSVGVNDLGGFMARVPVLADADSIVIEADVHPTKGKDGDTWISIGFGESPLEPQKTNVAWGDGVFLLLDTKGQAQCMFNPSRSNNLDAVNIKIGPAPAFVPDGFNKLKIEYQKSSNTVSMWVNDTQILKSYRLEKNDFTPNTSFAGFSGYCQMAGQASVANFSLSFTP